MSSVVLFSLAFLSLSVSQFSLEALGPNDELDRDYSQNILTAPMPVIADIARAKTKDIGVTDQYMGLPRVPLVHPYNKDIPNGFKTLLSLKGKMPRSLILMDPIIQKAMTSVGVTIDDPFLIVVQPYYTGNGSGQLLRPMYYFSQNNAYATPGLGETINLKAAVVGPGLSIHPDANVPANQFGISVHTGGVAGENVSSGANMALKGLNDKTSTAFFGFYKNTNRTVTGPSKQVISTDNTGVSVLHVLLTPQDVLNFEKVISSAKSNKVGDLLNALQSSKTDQNVSMISQTLKGMLDAEGQASSGFVGGALGQNPVITLTPGKNDEVTLASDGAKRSIIRLFDPKTSAPWKVSPGQTITVSLDVSNKAGLGKFMLYLSRPGGGSPLISNPLSCIELKDGNNQITVTIPQDVNGMEFVLVNENGEAKLDIIDYDFEIK